MGQITDSLAGNNQEVAEDTKDIKNTAAATKDIAEGIIKRVSPHARAVIEAKNIIKKLLPVIIAIIALFVMMFVIIFNCLTAGIAGLFGGSSGDENVYNSEQKYHEAFETLIEKTTDSVKDAYRDYQAEARKKGETLKSNYNKEDETVETEDEITNYTYSNEIVVTVSPEVDSLTLTTDVSYEMFARYIYLQYYLGTIYQNPDFKDKYNDEYHSIDDANTFASEFLKLVKECIKNSTGANKFFSTAIDLPKVTENRETTSEWTEEIDTGETKTIGHWVLGENYVTTTVYYEVGNSYYFHAGDMYASADGSYGKRYSGNTYDTIRSGCYYQINGIRYTGYAESGGNKIYKGKETNAVEALVYIEVEEPVMKTITHRDVTVHQNGTITVNVGMLPKVFLKYDYTNSKGLHRGIDTVIIEQGGRPGSIAVTNLAGVTSTQIGIIDAAYMTGTAGDSMCAGWVSNVFAKVGISISGNACDMWTKYTQYDYNTEIEYLKPGMIVAVDHACGPGIDQMGWQYGHVSIYIGNGIIRSNITNHSGGTVGDFTLSEWETNYGYGTIRFGYPPGLVEKIEQESTNTATVMINIAKSMAANDAMYGYPGIGNYRTDKDNHTGGYGINGEYDSGAFLSSVLIQAGIKQGDWKEVWKDNNYFEPNWNTNWLIENGEFERRAYGGKSMLSPGDILIGSGHAVMYIGNGQIVDATDTNEDGKRGDSSGNEIAVRPFYEGGWSTVYTLKTSANTNYMAAGSADDYVSAAQELYAKWQTDPTSAYALIETAYHEAANAAGVTSGIAGTWCTEFAVACSHYAGMDGAVPVANEAAKLVDGFKSRTSWYEYDEYSGWNDFVNDIKPGDIMVLDYGLNGYTSNPHSTIVTGVDYSAHTISTIEGGRSVIAAKYDATMSGMIWGFGRPDFGGFSASGSTAYGGDEVALSVYKSIQDLKQMYIDEFGGA